jgi:putative transposase
VLGVSESGHYAALTRPPSVRAIRHTWLTDQIRVVHLASNGTYGARRVHAEPHRQGHPVARCTVTRLMRGAGLRGITRAKGPRMTVPGARPDTRPDLVDRRFTAPAANAVWLTDIERHEALLNRAVVKGHRGRSVAAGR